MVYRVPGYSGENAETHGVNDSDYWDKGGGQKSKGGSKATTQPDDYARKNYPTGTPSNAPVNLSKSRIDERTGERIYLYEIGGQPVWSSHVPSGHTSSGRPYPMTPDEVRYVYYPNPTKDDAIKIAEEYNKGAKAVNEFWVLSSSEYSAPFPAKPLAPGADVKNLAYYPTAKTGGIITPYGASLGAFSTAKTVDNKIIPKWVDFAPKEQPQSIAPSAPDISGIESTTTVSGAPTTTTITPTTQTLGVSLSGLSDAWSQGVAGWSSFGNWGARQADKLIPKTVFGEYVFNKLVSSPTAVKIAKDVAPQLTTENAILLGSGLGTGSYFVGLGKTAYSFLGTSMVVGGERAVQREILGETITEKAYRYNTALGVGVELTEWVLAGMTFSRIDAKVLEPAANKIESGASKINDFLNKPVADSFIKPRVSDVGGIPSADIPKTDFKIIEGKQGSLKPASVANRYQPKGATVFESKKPVGEYALKSKVTPQTIDLKPREYSFKNLLNIGNKGGLYSTQIQIPKLNLWSSIKSSFIRPSGYTFTPTPLMLTGYKPNTITGEKSKLSEDRYPVFVTKEFNIPKQDKPSDQDRYPVLITKEFSLQKQTPDNINIQGLELITGYYLLRGGGTTPTTPKTPSTPKGLGGGRFGASDSGAFGRGRGRFRFSKKNPIATGKEALERVVFGKQEVKYDLSKLGKVKAGKAKNLKMPKNVNKKFK